MKKERGRREREGKERREGTLLAQLPLLRPSLRSIGFKLTKESPIQVIFSFFSSSFSSFLFAQCFSSPTVLSCSPQERVFRCLSLSPTPFLSVFF